MNVSEEQKFQILPPNRKEQVCALCKYLEKNECGYILVEKSYFDRVYLEDFIEYHLTAFPHYKKMCSRIHYFTSQDLGSLDGDQLKTQYLLKNNLDLENQLKTNYIGFSVIKPLPNIFIGRTSLRPPKNGDSFITNRNICHIFGHSIEFNALVFQEQDPTIGACASTSLWSIFHACAEVFDNVPTPAPSKITKIAATQFSTTTRIYPSCGMDPSQMISVIKSAGLETEYWESVHEPFKSDFKSLVYGYCHLPAPAILLLYLRSRDVNKLNEFHSPDHTVVVSGYKIDQDMEIHNDFQKRAEKVTSLYIHDDNGCSYLECPLIIEKLPSKVYDFDASSNIVKFHEEMIDNVCLKIPRNIISNLDPDGYEIAEIRGVIFPVHDKIRINLNEILKIMARLRCIIDEFLKVNENKPIWDIHLSTISDFKIDLFEQNIEDEVKIKLITNNYPRFFWRCICNFDGTRLMEFIFDATDLSTSIHVSESFFYNAKKLRRFVIFLKKERDGIIKALKSEEHYHTLHKLMERWINAES